MGGKIIKNFLKKLIIIFLVVTLILVAILKLYFNESIIKIGGVGVLMVLSGSMEPSISKNEMIIIKEELSYKEGDIITYKDFFGRLITHRIIKVDGEKVVTKGDSNDVPDEIIKKENIQGKVVFHSILLGFVCLYVLKPLIIIIFLGYLLKVLYWIIITKIFFKICKYC